jgi:DNA-directed RNA polymerase subunit N (RpoN/RPB10)
MTIIVVRCFTCGKVLSDKWRYYVKACEELDRDHPDEAAAATPEANAASLAAFLKPSGKAKILDDLGLNRMCCRRHMLSHVDLMDII